MGIRLVCSDLDGTLLQYGKKELEGEIFDQIRALHDRGILFCPASGRQYTSLRKLFAPVADCCIFLCENGGVIYKDEQCIAKNPMPQKSTCLFRKYILSLYFTRALYELLLYSMISPKHTRNTKTANIL